MKKQGYFLTIPYDWRWPTGAIIKERFWNKDDQRIFTPKVFGWGYSINFYALVQRLTGFFIVKNERKH